jgi:LPS sulfotransferase NodH
MNEGSLVKKHECERRIDFQPNPQLDQLIDRLSSLLSPVQNAVNRRFCTPRFPIVVVIGNPRSGGTLLTQVLALSGAFSYPSNLMSRFAYAPYVGALIQEMLFNPAFDFRSELADLRSTLSHASSLGKTTGALGINEFFHFWRRFFPTHEPGMLTPCQLAEVAVEPLRAEIASVESVFGRPFMSKGKMVQFNLDYFAQAIPEMFFVHITRLPRFVMQSVLLARRQYYGRDDIWWSVKPPEFDWLATLSPAAQIAGQIFFTDAGIRQSLQALTEVRSLSVTYEQLCENPQGVLEAMRHRLQGLGYDLPRIKSDERFICRNDFRLPATDLEPMESYFERFSSGAMNSESFP